MEGKVTEFPSETFGAQDIIKGEDGIERFVMVTYRRRVVSVPGLKETFHFFMLEDDPPTFEFIFNSLRDGYADRGKKCVVCGFDGLPLDGDTV